MRELGSQPLAQLGAHTHSHPMLSVLTPEEQLAEINRGAAIDFRRLRGPDPGSWRIRTEANRTTAKIRAWRPGRQRWTRLS